MKAINVEKVVESINQFNALYEDVMFLKDEVDNVRMGRSGAWDMLDELKRDVNRKISEINRIGADSRGTALVGYVPKLHDIGDGFVIDNPTRMRAIKAVVLYIENRMKLIDFPCEKVLSYNDCVLKVKM